MWSVFMVAVFSAPKKPLAWMIRGGGSWATASPHYSQIDFQQILNFCPCFLICKKIEAIKSYLTGLLGDLVNLSWVLALLVKSGSEDNLKGIQFNKHLMKTYLPLSHLIRIENSEFKDFRASKGNGKRKTSSSIVSAEPGSVCLEFPHNVFHPHKNMWFTVSLTP